MISLIKAIEKIETSRKNYEDLHENWEKWVRELYARVECTDLQTIFDTPSVRAKFKVLLDAIFEIEYELYEDGLDTVHAQMSIYLGFDCECESCQHGPVVIEHMKELESYTFDVNENNITYGGQLILDDKYKD